MSNRGYTGGKPASEMGPPQKLPSAVTGRRPSQPFREGELICSVLVGPVKEDMVRFDLYDASGQVRDGDGRPVTSWEYPWADLHDVLRRLTNRHVRRVEKGSSRADKIAANVDPDHPVDLDWLNEKREDTR